MNNKIKLFEWNSLLVTFKALLISIIVGVVAWVFNLVITNIEGAVAWIIALVMLVSHYTYGAS